MPVDQPQPVRIVSVPHPEQLARARLIRSQLDPLVVAVAKHELKRIDVPLEQPSQRQAARTN